MCVQGDWYWNHEHRQMQQLRFDELEQRRFDNERMRAIEHGWRYKRQAWYPWETQRQNQDLLNLRMDENARHRDEERQIQDLARLQQDRRQMWQQGFY